MAISVNGYKSKSAAIATANLIISPRGHNLKSVLGAPSANMKLAKNAITTYPLNLMPSDSSGVMDTCPAATTQCRELCLHTAGNPAHLPVKIAGRMARTIAYRYAKKAFIAALFHDIKNRVNSAKKHGKKVAFRLNTTSDIQWEYCKANVDGKTVYLMDYFSDVQFYDYTKIQRRADKSLTANWPANYHLTLSLTEDNDSDAVNHLLKGGKVAACITHKVTEMPVKFTLNGQTFDSFDADKTDYRPDDKPATIGLLRAKGKAKQSKYLGKFTREIQ